MNWWICLVAAIAYLMFVGWYFNWKGPLKGNEIDSFIKQLSMSQSPTDPVVLRKFLEEDDGKEFIMLNLVRFHDGKIEHPIRAKK